MRSRNTALALAVVLFMAIGAVADPALYWGSQTAFTGTAAASPDLVGPDGVEVPGGSNWLVQLVDLATGSVLFTAPAGSIVDIEHGASYGVFYATIADVGPRRGYSVGTRVFNADSEATATHWAMFSDSTALTWDTVPSAPATFACDAGRVAQGDWRKVARTVTFQPGTHGRLAEGAPALTVTVNHGDPAPAAPVATPEACWVFVGWSLALPVNIAADMETTAQYTPTGPHQADQSGDWGIQLSPELTRLIQFYNLGSYHRQAGTEDGYAPSAGETTGTPHQADQNGDWGIQLSPELTRLIQFYNSAGYRCAAGTEDGYAPGLTALKARAKPGTLSASRSLRRPPGDDRAFEVSVTLDHSQPTALTSLLVQESLSPGWQFAGGEGPATPTITPRPGDTGTLGFAWIAIPAQWPVRMTYRIIPGAAAKAVPTIRGRAGYREDAGEVVVGILASAPAPPDGEFVAAVDAMAVGSGRGLWDLSGTYAAVAAGKPLTLNLVHDTTGKLSGLATYALADGAAVTMPITGSVKGASGSIAMKGTLKGSDPAKTMSVSLALPLTVDTATRQLVGPLTGSIRSGGVTTGVNESLALSVPVPMDGTWALSLDLALDAKGTTGTARLTLSNGVEHAFVVRGRTAGETAVLSLAGDPADPSAKALRIKTTVTPLEDGWARLESFSGKGYGQEVRW